MTEQDNTGELLVRELKPAQRRALRDLEEDWPGSMALIERISDVILQRRPGATGLVINMIRAGVEAYRQARRDGEDDPERFGCFVDGLAEALPRKAQSLVARALTRSQRSALARRLPPSQDIESSQLTSSEPRSALDALDELDDA
jgi:hypothetical protein